MSQAHVAHIYYIDPNGRPRVGWDNWANMKLGDKLYSSPQQPEQWTPEDMAYRPGGLVQPNAEYERGFVDGMQKQMQSSVDRAVNRMAQPEQEADTATELRRLHKVNAELFQLVKDLQESASYWSEYSVPLGIVDRINAAIQKATGETE